MNRLTGYSFETNVWLRVSECIVLSGGLIENDEILIEKIRNDLGKYSMNAISRTVPIITSSFGDNAALMGSFSLILEKILQLEQNPLKLSKLESNWSSSRLFYCLYANRGLNQVNNKIS